MNTLKSLIIIILFVSLTNGLFAQIQIFELYGKIVDKEDKIPVAFANILNIKKNQATIADTSGNFRIIMSKGDTLRISSIGYQYAYFILRDTCTSTNQFATIYLSNKVYNLQAVDIYNERWKSFVYDFEHTEIKQDKTADQIERWLKTIIDVEELKLITQGARGAGFTIPYKTKREKSLAKLIEIKRREKIEAIANDRFNKDVVTKITGLHGEELDLFMKKCNFDQEFIVKTSEYELIVIIQEIFEVYQKEKNKN